MLDYRSEPEAHAEIPAGPRASHREYPLPRSVRRAIEYIHANLSDNVRLEDMAEAASLSTFHFAREFAKATGVAPHRYLMQARVAKVKELLGESDLCLAAIADEAGFTDQSHMSKVFKRMTGTTPKTFRDDRKLRAVNQLFASLDKLRSRVRRLESGGYVDKF